MLGFFDADRFKVDYHSFEFLPFGVLVRKLPELKIEFVNSFLRGLLSLDEKRVKSLDPEQSVSELFPLSSDNYAKLLRFERLGEPFKTLIQIETPALMWLECSVFYVGIDKCFEVFIDRTTETVLTKQLEEKTRDLETFAKVLSHDIKGGLFTLKGFLSLLEQGHWDSNSSKLIAGIKRSEEKLSRIVETCMGFYKTINQEPKFCSINIKTLLNAVVEQYFEELEAVGGVFEFDVGDIQIYGDENFLETIFRNLLSNSIKFRSPDRALLISVKTFLRGKYADVAFSDNGKGIKPDLLDKLFMPFSRFHSGVPGTGLGLNLVKKLIEKMGGSIRAEINDFGGLTIVVSLRVV
ncbi:MAG: HAMP domain-containing histidine kinase [Deltaproteobacteria bacterium]|nr:HAMP domain-containing histidine kinase [Deltaproteobacteria bacterium]